MTRERQVAQTLLSIVDHLVSGDDPAELMSELVAAAVRLMDVSASGALLADDQRRLHVVAASSGSVRTLELLQLQCDDGPCLDCFRSGGPVSVPDLEAAADRWPHFVPAAREAGFVSVNAVPLRLRDQVLGSVSLFGTTPGGLTREDAELAEALGHVAGVTLVAQRVAADRRQLTEQLERALQSRIVIEQCKGLLAATGGLEMDEAFRAMRRYARDRNLGLTAVARAVVARELSPSSLLADVRN